MSIFSLTVTRWSARGLAAVLVLMVIGVAAAQTRPVPSLDEIVARLKDGDKEVQIKALADLDTYLHASLSAEERLKAIAAAPDLPTTVEKRLMNPQLDVVHAVTDKPRKELLKPLEDVFERLGPKAQAHVIEYHLEVGTAESTGWFLERFEKQLEKYEWSWSLSNKILDHLPAEKAASLFVAALPHDRTSEMGVSGLLEGVEKGKLPKSVVAENLKTISDAFRPWLKKLDVDAAKARSKPPEDYRWEEEYRNAVAVTEYFPDLLGYGGKEAEGILRESLKAKAPRVSLFAIRSLVNMGLDVPAGDVELVAAEDETRNKLYENLKKAGRVKLFPEMYRTQDAFARSDMVEWLIYPTELDRAPNDIELMKVFEVNAPDGAIAIYLFRFRTTGDHWEAKDGWLAGVAGGYKKADMPTTDSTGLSFSSFAKWDSKTPDEHVASSRKLIEDAWKRESQKTGIIEGK